jgi:uncharacterized protein YcnI
MKKVLTILFTFILCFNLIAPTTAFAAVKLSKAKLTLDVRETFTLKVTGTSNQVMWASNNKKIATVSSKGKILAKAEGTATITATVSKKQYKCKVTVKDSEVKMVFGAMIFDGTTIDEYIKDLKEENPNYIAVEKYDEAHYTVTMLESDRLTLVDTVESEIEKTIDEYKKNDVYDGAFTDIKYDKLLSDIILYANKEKYKTVGYLTIVIPIAMISDYVQAINLVDLDDRSCKIAILDNKTNKILYQTK